MSLQCPYSSCRESVADESQRRPGYGVESTRLNPTMSTDAPLSSPHDEFDYDHAFLGGHNDDDFAAARTANNDVNELLLLVADNEEPGDKLFASAAVIDESFSSPAITAIMEQIKTRDRTALAAMQQAVEH